MADIVVEILSGHIIVVDLARGFSGFSGRSGYSGFSGNNPGTSGYSGFSGKSGFSGRSGYSGYSGVVTVGSSGYSGRSGYSGYSGQSGYSGFSGTATKCMLGEQMGTGTVCTVAAATTNFTSLFGGGATGLSATEANKQIHMPYAGTMLNLRVWTTGAQPGAGNMVITVRKEGANTALTCTVAAGAAAGLFSDLVNSVAFAAGDKFTLQIVNNDAATTSATIGSFSLEYDTP